MNRNNKRYIQLNLFEEIRQETPHEKLTRQEQEYENKLWEAQKKAHKEGRKIPTVIKWKPQ